MICQQRPLSPKSLQKTSVNLDSPFGDVEAALTHNLHDDNPVDGENQLRNIAGILEKVGIRFPIFWIITPRAFNRLSMRKQSINMVNWKSAGCPPRFAG